MKIKNIPTKQNINASLNVNGLNYLYLDSILDVNLGTILL